MINFRKKIELSIGDKVDLNVKSKRGQIKSLVINEEIAKDLYNHFIEKADKKKVSCNITKIESCIINQKFKFEMQNKSFSIVPKYNLLEVSELNTKKNISTTYYIDIEN